MNGFLSEHELAGVILLKEAGRPERAQEAREEGLIDTEKGPALAKRSPGLVGAHRSKLGDERQNLLGTGRVQRR